MLKLHASCCLQREASSRCSGILRSWAARRVPESPSMRDTQYHDWPQEAYRAHWPTMKQPTSINGSCSGVAVQSTTHALTSRAARRGGLGHGALQNGKQTCSFGCRSSADKLRCLQGWTGPRWSSTLPSRGGTRCSRTPPRSSTCSGGTPSSGTASYPSTSSRARPPPPSALLAKFASLCTADSNSRSQQSSRRRGTPQISGRRSRLAEHEHGLHILVIIRGQDLQGTPPAQAPPLVRAPLPAMPH